MLKLQDKFCEQKVYEYLGKNTVLTPYLSEQVSSDTMHSVSVNVVNTLKLLRLASNVQNLQECQYLLLLNNY